MEVGDGLTLKKKFEVEGSGQLQARLHKFQASVQRPVHVQTMRGINNSHPPPSLFSPPWPLCHLKPSSARGYE